MRKFFLALLCLCVVLGAGCSKKLPKPENVQAVLDEDGAVKVSWNASDGADCYRIYRKTEEAEDYKYICDLETLQYTDNDTKAGSSYRYKIETVYQNGISGGAETNSVTVADSSVPDNAGALSKPVITAVTRMDKYTAVLQIADSGDGCRYEVMRSVTANGKYSVIGQTDEPVYYDDSAEGTDYYYTVRKIKDKAESAVSSPVKVGTNAKKVFGVPVFMYHEFVTGEDLDGGTAFDKYAVRKDEFESDLIWLKNNGYKTVTAGELSDYLNGSGSMPEKPVIITIDDGKLGVYKNAYPLLKKYGMKASLSVIGAEIDRATLKPDEREKDSAPYCTWEEIGEMSKSGAVEIISHSYGLHVFSHDGRQGANCADGETVESFLPVAQKDFAKIRSKIQSATGTFTEVLAYPYSKRSETADKAWLKSGYSILLSGDDTKDRLSSINYFIRDAGINSKSAVLRRIARMTGTPLKDYLEDMLKSNSY